MISRTLQVSLIFMLYLLFLGVELLIVLPTPDPLQESIVEVVNHGSDELYSLEERIAIVNNIPEEKWIKANKGFGKIVFKGDSNASDITTQLTEPFELSQPATIEADNGAIRVLLLRVTEEGGVEPLKYIYDSEIISEKGTFRLNIFSEYNYRIIIRR